MPFKVGDIVHHVLPPLQTDFVALPGRCRKGVVVIVNPDDRYIVVRTNVNTCPFELDGRAFDESLGYVHHIPQKKQNAERSFVMVKFVWRCRACDRAGRIFLPPGHSSLDLSNAVGKAHKEESPRCQAKKGARVVKRF